MIKYTILYKNGKTWSGKAKELRDIPAVDCLVMSATKPRNLVPDTVHFWTLTSREGLPRLFHWHVVDHVVKDVKPPRTPNPASKTKKQKKFDKDYAEWRSLTKSQELKRSGFVYEDDVSIKAYKKWLYEQKQEKYLSEVAGALPGYKVALYTNDAPQKIAFPSGATISWDGVYKPWRESAIEKFHLLVEEIQKRMAEVDSTIPERLAVLCKESTWKELGWGSRTKPIKTTYTFWLGALGEIND